MSSAAQQTASKPTASRAARPAPGYWVILPLCLGIITVIFGGYEIVERRWLRDVDMATIHLFHYLRGILSSLVVGIATAWLLLRRVVPAFPPAAGPALALARVGQPDDRLHWQAAWLIQMRWLAVLAGACLVLLAGPLMHMLPAETLPRLLAVIGLLAVVNLALRLRARSVRRPASWILAQIVVDLVLLTALLHFSGGLENPLHTIYLFHVIIAGVVLSRHATYLVVATGVVCLGLLGAAELLGWLEHYTITIFPHPGAAHAAAAGVDHASHDPVFVASRILTFAGVLALTSHFVTLIVAELRRREEQLVDTAREALNEHRKLVAAVDAAGAGMVLLSPDFRIRWVNSRMSDWFGLDAEHWNLDCSSTPWGTGGGCEECPSRQAARAGRPEVGERVVVGADGRERVFQITASPLRNERGEISEIVELVQDVTERRAVQAELMHADRMAILGRLAAGLAHEIGNPLSSLSTRLQLLEERRDGEFVQESIGLIQRQIHRIARIVHGISGLSRTGSGDWGLVDINACIAETINLLETDQRAGRARVTTDLDRELPPTLAVKDELLQVFLNIGINALESMDGGQLRITSHRAGGEIHVAFHDEGIGMTAAVRSQLFTPFFTTKQEGTGLGLSLSYQIVQAHGGRIGVESEPGQGTTFRVSLPLRASSRLDPGEAGAGGDTGGRGRHDAGTGRAADTRHPR